MSIVVLGMHRSGTSLLVGLLGQFGYNLGQVSSSVSPLKPTGTKENIQVRKINNLLLSSNMSSWDNPPQKLVVNNEVQTQMLLFSESLEKKWAIKDPRTLLSYKIWKEYLPKHNILATIRHPLLVAQSLKTKNNISELHALNLWLVYNQKLLSLWNESPFPIINFDKSKNQYYHDLKLLETYLDIEIDWTLFNQFYSHTKANLDHLNLSMYPEINKVFSQLIDASKKVIFHG